MEEFSLGLILRMVRRSRLVVIAMKRCTSTEQMGDTRILVVIVGFGVAIWNSAKRTTVRCRVMRIIAGPDICLTSWKTAIDESYSVQGGGSRT